MIIKRAFIGDTAECSKWYPFALSKLKELKRGRKILNPIPNVYIELKKGDHIGEILIMAGLIISDEAERRFLFVWVVDFRGLVAEFHATYLSRLKESLSVILIRRRGEKLTWRIVSIDLVKLNWDAKKLEWPYGGIFQCARFDLANPDQFVAVFKRTETDNRDKKTDYITTVRFKLVKNKDGRMEIWEVYRNVFSYVSYVAGIHEFGSEWWLLGSKLTHAIEEREYFNYHVVDIYVKGNTIKYLGLYSHQYNYHNTEQHYSIKGRVPLYVKWENTPWYFDGWVFPNKTPYVKWTDEYKVFFGGFNTFVYEWGRGAQSTITYITTSADTPMNWAQADYWEITLNKGEHGAWYPKAILNENSFLYVKIDYTFDREEAVFMENSEAEITPYRYRYAWLKYSIHPPMEVRMSNPDTLVYEATEELANYETYVEGGGKMGGGGMGGWSGLSGFYRTNK